MVRAAGDHGNAIAAEENGVDRSGMALQAGHLSLLGDVPDLHGLILARRYQELAAGREDEAAHLVGMAAENGKQTAGGNIPELDGLVPASARHSFAIG